MKRTPFPFCALLILLGYNSTLFAGASVPSDSVAIVNEVKECVIFTPSNIEKTSNGIVLHTKADFKKSTGDCGCMSRLLSYSVSEKINIEGKEVEYERLYARKIAPDASVRNYPFIISADPKLTYRGKVALTIKCKSPD